MSGPGASVSASAGQVAAGDRPIYLMLASFLLVGAGSTRTCTRTRNSSKVASLRAARPASRSGVRCRTTAATAPAPTASCEFAARRRRQPELRSASARGSWRRTAAVSRLSRRRRVVPGGERRVVGRDDAGQRLRACGSSCGWRARRGVSGAGERRRARVGGVTIEHHSRRPAPRRGRGRSRWTGGTGPSAALALLVAVHRLHARCSTSSRCATRRRPSTRGCRRSCSPTSARRRCATQETRAGPPQRDGDAAGRVAGADAAARRARRAPRARSPA